MKARCSTIREVVVAAAQGGRVCPGLLRRLRISCEGRSPLPFALRNVRRCLANAQSLVYTKSAGWADTCEGVLAMCDYSLHGVRSRPAKISDRLVTKDFGTGTRGFASVTDATMAVCLLPGTEVAFSSEVTYAGWTFGSLMRGAFQVKTPHKTAIFREINKGKAGIHRDALEFPDGNVV